MVRMDFRLREPAPRRTVLPWVHSKAEQGNKEHADGLGAPLVAPFFQEGHKDDDQNGGENLAGVADALDVEAKEVGAALGRQQGGGAGGDHGRSQSHGNQFVAAEFGGGGEGHQNGQIIQCRVGHIIEDLIHHIGGREEAEGGEDGQDGLQDAGACDGGNQRLENAHHVVQDQAANVLFAAGCGGGCCGVEAAQLEQLIVYLDDIVSDDHLALGAACDDAHDAGGLFQCGSIRLGGVGQGEAQPGGTVFQMRDVFISAHQAQNVRSSLLVVFHLRNPPC